MNSRERFQNEMKKIDAKREGSKPKAETPQRFGAQPESPVREDAPKEKN